MRLGLGTYGTSASVEHPLWDSGEKGCSRSWALGKGRCSGPNHILLRAGLEGSESSVTEHFRSAPRIFRGVEEPC